MEGKEWAFKGYTCVWWEQGDVTQQVLQLEHCQDLTALVKLNIALLARKGLSHSCYYIAKERKG